MEPLARLPHPVLTRLAGVVFDIDDTVTRHGRLELRAFEAMWRLHDAGLVLLPVTGRPIGWVEVLARQWPVAGVVAENGACWVHQRDGRLEVSYFDGEAVRAEQAAAHARIRAQVAARLPTVALTTDHHLRRCDLAYDIGESHALPAADIAALRTLVEAEGAVAVVSSVHLHAQVGSHDKARGARAALREVAGIDLDAAREQFLFVGDSGNDQAAFAWFPYSVGVANVRDHLAQLEARPRYVTLASHGAGFAEVADAILSARSQNP